jgi:sugar lactone lactonase YvrE
MSQAGNITSVTPQYALPGAEIEILVEGFHVQPDRDHGCFLNGIPAQIVAASMERVLAIVPPSITEVQDADVYLESGGDGSNTAEITVGGLLVDDMHMVANPAVDPNDDSIILTRSGSRGQQMPASLYRLEADGYLDEMPVEFMNPTGIAFDPAGDLYVTNRNDGTVCRIDRGEEAVPYATGLGIATGLAFDGDGIMYVGDRSGTIYKIETPGEPTPFATLDPSVSAYHMAFGPDGRLYVTAPGLASHDVVYAIDVDGEPSVYAKGFGRPQGMAFDTDGNLYVAACYRGRHGIVRIAEGGEDIENFIAGNNIVGLCLTRDGDMIIATNEAVYELPIEIEGTL